MWMLVISPLALVVGTMTLPSAPRLRLKTPAIPDETGGRRAKPGKEEPAGSLSTRL
jgi:hypothetical protein